MAIEFAMYPFNNGNNPVSLSSQRKSCQDGQFYVSFNFGIGLENYSNPLNSSKQITARLEYPYSMSESQQMFDLSKYKSVEKEGIKKYFPAVQNVELYKFGEVETNRLTMHIDTENLSSFENSHGIRGLKYNFTFNFESFYVIQKNQKYIIDLYAPKEMSTVIRKYCAWERFLEAIAEILQTHCTFDIEKVSVHERNQDNTTKIIALPVNLEMDELNKMILEQWLTYAQAIRSEDLKHLQFLKKHTCNSTTRRTAEIVQLAPVDQEFVVVDPGETTLPLAPSLANIEQNIAVIQREFSITGVNKSEVLEEDGDNLSIGTQEEWERNVETLQKYDLLADDPLFLFRKVFLDTIEMTAKALLRGWLNMITRVKPGGEWDFKKYGDLGIFEDFGNYHFGIIAASIGVTKIDAVKGAGLAQLATDLMNLRLPSGSIKYHGDSERDAEWIKKGMEAYFSQKYKTIKFVKIDFSCAASV